MKFDKRLATLTAAIVGGGIAAWIWAPADISVSGFRFLVVFVSSLSALTTAVMLGLLDDDKQDVEL